MFVNSNLQFSVAIFPRNAMGKVQITWLGDSNYRGQVEFGSQKGNHIWKRYRRLFTYFGRIFAEKRHLLMGQFCWSLPTTMTTTCTIIFGWKSNKPTNWAVGWSWEFDLPLTLMAEELSAFLTLSDLWTSEQCRLTRKRLLLLTKVDYEWLIVELEGSKAYIDDLVIFSSTWK